MQVSHHPRLTIVLISHNSCFDSLSIYGFIFKGICAQGIRMHYVRFLGDFDA